MRMTNEILIAGFGGQGVLSMGKTLAYGGVLRGKEVTWLPSYGPEQRGGTSNVTVVISDERISSPIVDTYDVVIALNQQSLTKFESRVKPGGILMYDKYGIQKKPTRTDIRVYGVDATETANANGLQKMTGIMVLGALLSVDKILDNDAIMESLKKALPERDSAQHGRADDHGRELRHGRIGRAGLDRGNNSQQLLPARLTTSGCLLGGRDGGVFLFPRTNDGKKSRKRARLAGL